MRRGSEIGLFRFRRFGEGRILATRMSAEASIAKAGSATVRDL